MRQVIIALPRIFPHTRFLSWHSPSSLFSTADHSSLSSLLPQTTDHHLPLAVSLVSTLKSLSSSLCSPFTLLSGQQLHALALKTGLAVSNLFVRNSLLNLYANCRRLDVASRLFLSSPPSHRDIASYNIMVAAHVKSGQLDCALHLFDEMPHRDCVSFTTVIMGLSWAARNEEALMVFRDMCDDGVTPNEVTLASVLSACSRLSLRITGMVHAVAVRCGFEAYVLVATNLVHCYAMFMRLEDACSLFDRMPERNTVTWNAMLNGYAKAGLVDQGRDLFERIPVKDLVSWATMVDGYLRAERFQEAMLTYKGMLRNSDARPNGVLLVDLVSACGRLSAVQEGQQLHTVIMKSGLDCHNFVQATMVHFYGACNLVDDACVQFESGSKSHSSSWSALMVGLLKNNLVDEARQLFDAMPDRDVVSWSAMIAGYVQIGYSDLALELFWKMLSTDVEPNEITLVSVLSAVASSGTLEQGKWIHDYIISKSIHLTDNLSAGLIDMYAKCGSIPSAMQVFCDIKEKVSSVSPWNAIICGLAIHGRADMSLSMFSELRRTNVKPNSITFIGVLNACCHSGLLAEGRHYFESMKREYDIEPTIKHYGCIVDLLGRAGCVEEAEQLVKTMPMKADVVIWGSILAAARTHGNVDIGQRAAESLAKLEPSHGAARVTLSNIYADAGRWGDVLVTRKAMQSRKVKKTPGCSGIL
ncbi:pentatricopeptide repeat-containing protein At5g19020, mitochondrial-like isoform X1 [Typha latifolia]|uniref:pentatricopeptide repeat-containing protein At5g19020, mitochondrial-like isoform X1 n=1 Tax=Typha latifolia TaxID=4733 RepID=UPI003C2AE050